MSNNRTTLNLHDNDRKISNVIIYGSEYKDDIGNDIGSAPHT